MARNNDRGGSNRRAPKDAGRRIKKKPCALCKDRVEWVDYKDVAMLRKYMSDRGKIRARRVSGNCTQHQRDVAIAIKTARELVLLPYTQRTTTERPGGRGRGGGYGSSGPGRRGRDGDRGPAGEGRPAAATTTGPGDGDGTAPVAGGAEDEAGAAEVGATGAAPSELEDVGEPGEDGGDGAGPASASEVVAEGGDGSASETGGDDG
jgi:small subunit ribosomal protein S18